MFARNCGDSDCLRDRNGHCDADGYPNMKRLLPFLVLFCLWSASAWAQPDGLTAGPLNFTGSTYEIPYPGMHMSLPGETDVGLVKPGDCCIAVRIHQSAQSKCVPDGWTAYGPFMTGLAYNMEVLAHTFTAGDDCPVCPTDIPLQGAGATYGSWMMVCEPQNPSLDPTTCNFTTSPASQFEFSTTQPTGVAQAANIGDISLMFLGADVYSIATPPVGPFGSFSQVTSPYSIFPYTIQDQVVANYGSVAAVDHVVTQAGIQGIPRAVVSPTAINGTVNMVIAAPQPTATPTACP